MVQESIKTALRNFGLTEKELEVYLSLAKRGVQKTGQIAKQLKMNKGLIYRILKNLQKKGVVEATLESPTRYAALPFEKVINSYIKSKREEAEKIEEAKDSLLSDWRRISQEEIDSSLEKFGVIEGKKKIFHKISQLFRETNKKISMVVTVSDLGFIDQFGVLEILNNTIRNTNIDCQLLTQISKSNLRAIKLLKPRIEAKIDLRGLSSSLGTPKFFRMIMRDEEEVLLFMSDEVKKDNCLFTNSNTIVQAFKTVFEDLWFESNNMKDSIVEVETGKTSSKTQIIKNPNTARNLYNQVLNSAQDEIQIVTSSKGLIELTKKKLTLKEWSDRNISVKIMAPIVNENLIFAQELMKFGEVKHIPLGYFQTTIIDGQHLFQFKQESKEEVKSSEQKFFENTFYTNDLGYIESTKKLLKDLWKKTRIPFSTPLQEISFSNSKKNTHKALMRIWKHDKLKLDFQSTQKVSEKDVLDKFREIKMNYARRLSDDIQFLGTRAYALIHPPEHFQLPDMLIGILYEDEASTFGSENVLKVFLRVNNSKDSPFQLVTHIQNNPKSMEFRKSKLSGFPGFENIILVRKEQLTVRVHGNTLFAGWTVPIQLFPSKYVIPPACLLFEGYGKVHSGIFNLIFPSGSCHKIWYNNLDAFVTFFHPSSKYIGSGTEGTLDRESVQIPYS